MNLIDDLRNRVKAREKFVENEIKDADIELAVTRIFDTLVEPITEILRDNANSGIDMELLTPNWLYDVLFNALSRHLDNLDNNNKLYLLFCKNDLVYKGVLDRLYKHFIKKGLGVEYINGHIGDYLVLRW